MIYRLNLLCVALAALLSFGARATNVEPPPDPGLEVSVHAAETIAEVEIVAGGPFRAVAMPLHILKGSAPAIFEVQGFNSYNWDTVHHGLALGSRWILFLSKTERPDLFDCLTPSAPRFSVTADSVMINFGDPPVRIPVKPAALESCLALLIEKDKTGKIPEDAAGKLRDLWAQGEIEPRYLAVEMAGALREQSVLPFLLEASKDKLLKLRLRAIEALGKLASPEALGALRGLLGDEKKSVAREAVRTLVRVRDASSLLELLAWARKNAAVPRTGGKSDPELAKNENLAAEIVTLARAAGFFADTGHIARGLLELAQVCNSTLAGDALGAAAALAPGDAIPTLIELAQDPLNENRDRALTILKRLALKPVKDADEFAAWWKESKSKLNEDGRRDVAEAAVRNLAHAEDYDSRRAALDALRRLPGGIALVSASPLLLKNPGADYFNADDYTAWDSPLAIPFLIERLGRESSSQRRYALDALVTLCEKHPRLNAALWPLIRAQLSEREPSLRRAAELAVGTLVHTDGMTALFDGMAVRGVTEPGDAWKSLYALTARTLGYSLREPVPDQLAARASLRGWWDSMHASFAPLAVATPLNPFAIYPGEASVLRVLNGDENRAATLEALALKEDSESSEAALTLLLAERGPEDAFWKKLLGAARLRDRARGMLGALGRGGALDEWKKNAADAATPPLLRALTILSLCPANAPKESAANGAKALVEWLNKEGAKAPLPLKRLAVLSLGLAPAEETSRAYLEKLLEAGLGAEAPEPDTTTKVDDEESDYSLLRAALVALCARPDGNAGLLKALDKSTETRVREVAARELSLRRDRAALPGIVKALEKSDRYTWLELTGTMEPLLTIREANEIAGLLASTKNTTRAGAVWILSRHLEFGNDTQSKKRLISALDDESNLVRYYAAESLGKRKVAEAVEPLVKLLEDLDDEVRAAAAQALGEIGEAASCRQVAQAALVQYRIDARWFKALAISESPKYMEIILKYANSNLYLEQRAGLEALAAASTTEAKERLLKAYRSDDEALQTVASDLLAQRGDDAVSWIADDLKATDRASRARAYHLLAHIRSAASRAALSDAEKREQDAGLLALIKWAAK